jgi:starch phosphorylase
MALGRVQPGNRSEPLCMTVLALNTTTQANGVSRLHGEVSRKMWADLYANVPVEEVPIQHVKNGIHIPTWYSREVAMLFSRYLGPGWQEDPKDREVWNRVDRIPDAELWRARCRLRERLVSFTRSRVQDQFRRRGLPHTVVRAAEEVLDPDALTICFARRFAVYKRANLLLSDPDRLDRLVNDPERPVQILFAGKAHPADQPGKQVMREIIHLASETRFRHRIVFLEDYGIDVARILVQGADVWLNTPRRPLEASGTSGMKAAVSGGLHLSVLDGWWDEAYTPETGWAIGNAETYESPEIQDQVESEALYDLLAQEVVPLFYERGSDGLPREWITRIKASMIAYCPIFNANRMVGEYARHYYLPAHERFSRVEEDQHSGARELASWRQRVSAAWSNVAIARLTCGEGDLPVGQAMPVRVEVNLGSLAPEDVVVEAVHGEVESGDSLRRTESVPMRMVEHHDGRAIFEGEIQCRTTGHRGLSVRIRPIPRLNPANPFDANLVTWWEGGTGD